MTGTNTNTILYRNDSSIIDLNNTQQIDRNQDFTKRISNDEAPAIRISIFLKIWMLPKETPRPRSTRATISAICRS